MPKRRIDPEEIPQILQALACEEENEQQSLLRDLCPCRSECYDTDVWIAICQAYGWGEITGEVAGQAFHALQTLEMRAQPGNEAHKLLDWLEKRGYIELPVKHPGTEAFRTTKEPKPKEKIRSRDVPRMLETLACGEAHEQQRALQLLCPCRNARYDKEVWLAIFRAYKTSGDGHVRDQAGHAIGTLLERAQTDPRSQELLLWLEDQEIVTLPVVRSIPLWDPFGRAGLNHLYIPRYERSHRSKANRRR